MHIFKNYHDLVYEVLHFGNDTIDRTNVGTRSVFGRCLTFPTNEGFPILTTKKINFNAVLHELLWFISGSTNIDYLKRNNVNIWNEWADEYGELGPVYGKQWRSWNNIDQLAAAIQSLRSDPHSRRHIISAWNVSELDEMRLPPCHNFFQFNITNSRLDIMVNMRSVDLFLGLPFNISSYATLLKMVSQCCELNSGYLIMTLGNAHIYHNHFTQCETMLKNEPLPLPELLINSKVKEIDDFKFEDFELVNYKSHKFIHAPIAI